MINKVSSSFIVILMMVFTVYAGVIDRIQKAYEDRDFYKAEKLIRKSMAKDSVNPGAKYYYSLLFLDSAFARYNIDSSSYYIEAAHDEWAELNPKKNEELVDVGISLPVILEQRSSVAQEAFKLAAIINSVVGWDVFRARYPYSDLMDQATYLRDSLAYQKAKKRHSWKAYKVFLDQYEHSAFAGQAKQNYDKLLFDDLTGDKQTQSYISFLKQHPGTPFRKTVEKIIFERTTVFNLKEDYIQFIRSYPESHLIRKAADMAYCVSADTGQVDQQVFQVHPAPDSLVLLHELNQRILNPLYVDHKFGFMDSDGNTVLPTQYLSVAEDYLCGNVSDNWLKVYKDAPGLIVSRKGDVLLTDVEHFQSLSPSIKLVQKQHHTYLYHASGFRILDQGIDDAQILANGWVKFQQNDQWGLCAPSGKVLLEADYESIERAGSFLIVGSGDLLSVTTISQLGQGDFTPDFQYDDYELVQDTLLQIFFEDQEGILDRDLKAIVPTGQQEIYTSGTIWYLEKPTHYQVVRAERNEIVGEAFSAIQINKGWLALKNENWTLFARTDATNIQETPLDSVKLLCDFATYIQKQGTLELLFSNGKHVPLAPSNQLSVFSMPGGTSSYVDIRDGNEHKVIDQNALMLFQGDFDELVLIADSLFKYKYRGKTGVKRSDGTTIISAKYDVVDMKDELLFLLKDGKIGAYDFQNGALIPAAYETRIKKIGAYYQVAQKSKFGLVNALNKEVLPCRFDELINWNENSIWVRDGLDWSLIDLDAEVILDEVHKVRMWFKTGEEQLAIVSGEDGYGLYGNVRGEILPIQYNEILNVSNTQQPLFFAEQHLKAAKLYVVTYFNASGETIKSIPYRPQEYDIVYCDQ